MKGKLIVLEGIDGCGKSTQIDLLAKWLIKSNLIPKHSQLHITKEPGGTSLGKSIRNLLLNTDINNSPEPLTELLLYAADRAQHISQLIRPALENGDWVISDRFTGSTIAYQGYGRKLSLSLIKTLEEIATQGISPDITFLLDISAKNSIARRSERIEDRIEKEGIIFLKNVSIGFKKLAKERKWITIQANENIEKVSGEIQSFLKNNCT